METEFIRASDAPGDETDSTTAAPHSALVAWGWDMDWARAFEPSRNDGLEPGRVVAQHRGRFTVVGSRGELPGTPSGRFRHAAGDGELPVVGDWVACQVARYEARIDAVLPRRSAFRRRAAGSQVAVQMIAANVDTLFVTTSLRGDLNFRRLERYVAMGRESGATPVVLLTKADLVVTAEAVDASNRIARDLGVPAVPLSGRTGDGTDALGAWLRPGATVATVGSSGVGKSTLLNWLAGQELMATSEIREGDARGRHTTTHRELFRLPNGALLLDTPGMRELGLWDAEDGVEETFGEIARLAADCRFSDCRHEREPGCAVRAAIETGLVDERRLRSYQRLTRELAEVPPPALRREANRKFARMVRHASEDSMARKAYRFDG